MGHNSPVHKTKKLPQTLGSTNFFQVDEYIYEDVEYAVAKSTDDMIGVTWNPEPSRPYGYPHTHQKQQWFVLPPPLASFVRDGIILCGK